MYRMAAFGLSLVILGILTGGVLALVLLLLVAFTYGVRRLDSDIDAWDGMAGGGASRLWVGAWPIDALANRGA